MRGTFRVGLCSFRELPSSLLGTLLQLTLQSSALLWTHLTVAEVDLEEVIVDVICADDVVARVAVTVVDSNDVSHVAARCAHTNTLHNVC